MLRTLGLFTAIAMSSLHANAAESMQLFGITLLQPEYVFQERVPKVADLSAYLKAVQAEVGQVAASRAAHPPASGFIVLAVRPGNKSAAWLDIMPPLSTQEASRVLAAAKNISPPSVRGGVVVVALKIGLWGGPAPVAVLPSPAEWRAAAAAAGKPVEAGELVEMVWPE